MDKPYRLSAKAVIYDEMGRILLLQRSFCSKGNPGKWDLPGGKVEQGESLSDALLREIVEETGLDVQLERVIGAAESESPNGRVAYLILAASCVGGKVELSDEHPAYAWVSTNEIVDMEIVPQFIRTIKEFVANMI